MIFKLSLVVASILLTFGNINANELHQRHEVLCNNTSNIIDNNTELYPQLVNNNEQLLDKNVDVCDNIFTNINKTVSNNTEGQLSEDNVKLCNKVLTNTNNNNIKSENDNNQSLFNDNAILCNKILNEIGKVLNTNNIITQQSCCGQICNLTMGAYCVAEQLKLASDYLKTDSPDSDIFKEHAKVFNLLLDILQKKANKYEITTSQFLNDRIKLYLNTIVPVNI